MKKIIAAVILSVAVVRLSGAYDLSTAGENRVFYKNVLQKIRIEKYDKFSKDYEEKKAQLNLRGGDGKRENGGRSVD